MKIKKNSSHPVFSDLVRSLEAQLSQIPSYSMRILKDDGSLCGICLLSPDLETTKREAIEDGINKCEDTKVKHYPAKIALFPKRKVGSRGEATREKECGYDYFMENLFAISHQATMTRIPFSLLLFQSDYSLGGKELSALTANIQEGLHREEIFSVHDLTVDSGEAVGNKRFAVIMPTAGLNKARRRSEEIRQSVQLCEGVPKKKLGLSIGLGVSYAGEGISVQDFLSSIEKCLKEALSYGNCTRWEKGTRSVNSCQVTAEERAQLFGCLK